MTHNLSNYQLALRAWRQSELWGHRNPQQRTHGRYEEYTSMAEVMRDLSLFADWLSANAPDAGVLEHRDFVSHLLRCAREHFSPNAAARTLVLVKPDAVARGLVGTVLARLEEVGLRIERLRMLHPERARIEAHYVEHAAQPFFEPLVDFMCSGAVVALVLEGADAVGAARDAVRALREELAESVRRNLAHAADSAAAAAREEALWFGAPAPSSDGAGDDPRRTPSA